MFRKTARNFNQPMATAGKVCVAEVEEIVPVGSLDPDCIHLPSIYVKRMILGAPYDKKIEFRTDAAAGGGVSRDDAPARTPRFTPGDRPRLFPVPVGMLGARRRSVRPCDRRGSAPHPSPPAPRRALGARRDAMARTARARARASSLQAYRRLPRLRPRRGAQARPRDSVVLADGSTLAAPRFVPCGDKPLAVVLDADETAIQNLGYEYAEASAAARLRPRSGTAGEQTGADAVAPMPGAVTALRALREAGVTMIFNTNRLAAHAAQTAAALERRRPRPGGPRRDAVPAGRRRAGIGQGPRRARIAERYCVIAMAGDQLGDFSDLFNVRTLAYPSAGGADLPAPFASLWGNGWFMLSNPVYGTELRGDFDDVFPPDSAGPTRKEID